MAQSWQQPSSAWGGREGTSTSLQTPDPLPGPAFQPGWVLRDVDWLAREKHQGVPHRRTSLGTARTEKQQLLSLRARVAGTRAAGKLSQPSREPVGGGLVRPIVSAALGLPKSGTASVWALLGTERSQRHGFSQPSLTSSRAFWRGRPNNGGSPPAEENERWTWQTRPTRSRFHTSQGFKGLSSRVFTNWSINHAFRRQKQHPIKAKAPPCLCLEGDEAVGVQCWSVPSADACAGPWRKPRRPCSRGAEPAAAAPRCRGLGRSTRPGGLLPLR